MSYQTSLLTPSFENTFYTSITLFWSKNVIKGAWWLSSYAPVICIHRPHALMKKILSGAATFSQRVVQQILLLQKHNFGKIEVGGGDSDFSIFLSPILWGQGDGNNPALSPTARTENITRVRVPILKRRHFPFTARTFKKELSCTLAPLFQGYPCRWGLWKQMTGALVHCTPELKSQGSSLTWGAVLCP